MNKEDATGTETGPNIAIIGMTGHFPGARDIKEFWENLIHGVESICFFSNEELEKPSIDPEHLNAPNCVKARGVLEDFENFDAAFFGYTPREAEKMDPQMRVFHQCAWHALEDAGYVPDTYNGSIGLYGGATTHSSWDVLNQLLEKNNEPGRFSTFQLSDRDHMNSRISYKLNLTGPSFIMETQCSTSLVAVHLACQGLLGGECDMALAGGISISLPKKSGYFYHEGMIVSPDGHCRAFDAKANGTIFGNGVGIVVLKRIEDAIADGDHIFALIKGTAINNDGSRKAGYSAPSVEGQADVIRAALQVSEVEPESISYVETHGTGTTLGDPIEIEALNLAFNTPKKGFCRIGSLKPNVGHLDNAAGVASLIKAVLALTHRVIPPSIHFETPNPQIDFDNSPFRVNAVLTEWNNDQYSLRAGVSSFGIGGTNAHVVLEEWPHAHGVQRTVHSKEHPAGNLVEGTWSQGRGGVSSPEKSRQYQLILLSARTETALEKMTENLAAYFKTNPGVNLADAAYTLHLGRKSFHHRRMLVCSTVQEAINGLSVPGSGKLQTFDTKGRKPPVVLMCSPIDTNSCADYWQWGTELYNREPGFRQESDRCFEILKSMMDCDIKEILYPGDLVRKVSEVSIAQPLLFAFEYALVKLLMHWEIKPQVIIGHGPGETVAACLNGDLSLEDALNQAVNNQNPQPSSHPSEAFSQSISHWLKKPNTLFLETGPGQVLTRFVKKHSGIMPGHQFVNLIKNPQQDQPGKESLLRHLLTQVGRMWLYGVTLNWITYYSAEKRQRVSLPGYSFDAQPYASDYEHLRQRLRKEKDEDKSPSFEKQTAITDWFYIPSWERTFFRSLLEIPADKTWLIFMDNCGIGSTLVKQLEEKTQCPSLIFVSQGTAFNKVSDEHFVIDPQETSHYDTLFNELQKQGKIPAKILHLWGVSTEEPAQLMPEHNHQAQQVGFYSLLNIVTALGKAGIGSPLRLEVVTTNMQEVTGEEKINPLKATILGAVKVIPLEYPNIQCRSIDILLSSSLVPGTPDSSEDDVTGHLLAELSWESNGRPMAFRGKYRWEQTIAPAPLEKINSRQNPCFKQEGVYLITGGLGGMGLTFAEHLTEHFKACLILIGRSSLADKDLGNQKKQKIRQLEQLGAQVMVAAADVSHLQQMQTVVRQAIGQFGRIDGIIHAAGVADYAGVIQRRTREMTEQVLAPKVTGTLVLDHLLKQEKIEPDFFVLCSSISAINAPFGEVGYTAANAFLDAYAHYKKTNQKGQIISINWGPWQEVGMAVDALKRKSAKQGEKEATLEDGISPAEGIEILTRAIASGFPRAAVSTRNLKVIIEKAGMKSPPETPQDRPRHPRPELTTPYTAPRDEIEEKLVNIWIDFLGVEKVGIHDNFFELGASSLDIVQVNRKLENLFNRQVPVATLFTYPTIDALKKYLDQEDGTTAFSGEESQRLEKISSTQKHKLKQRKKTVIGE